MASAARMDGTIKKGVKTKQKNQQPSSPTKRAKTSAPPTIQAQDLLPATDKHSLLTPPSEDGGEAQAPARVQEIRPRTLLEWAGAGVADMTYEEYQEYARKKGWKPPWLKNPGPLPYNESDIEEMCYGSAKD
ncbi:hypothetical protein AJ80_00007 [Polytolypa hystricis UAMH7299]|uniref:Uncharacterized protein n=1 Tax=Polytolypa hystricis (strain UAMH7299) TaxID=1447883 RepID=A0A2B7Z5J1_POLH7|nr:hypothetical protein AJ80_00007 [Polytolypa hystricis UAMH7299]